MSAYRLAPTAEEVEVVAKKKFERTFSIIKLTDKEKELVINVGMQLFFAGGSAAIKSLSEAK